MFFTQDQYRVHFQSSRTVYVRIEILNQQDIVLDNLEGIAIDGRVNVSSESLIRRSADIKFVLNRTLLPSEESRLWINNRVRLWIGLMNFKDEIQYFNLGIFIINDPSVDISIVEKTISIKLMDKMFLLENTSLEFITRLNEGVNISTAMRSTVQTLGGENRVLIDTHHHGIPYDLEFTPTDNVLSIITELNNLYMNWESFYDVSGRFVFRQSPNRLNDPIIWSFTEKADFRTDSQLQINYANIKNYIKVIGRTLDNGTTVMAIAENNDANSPFSIGKIGKKALTLVENKYFTNEQCLQLANYKLFKHSSMAETVNISCIPIYMLDVNMLVEFNSPEDGLIGRYSIIDITLPLNFSEKMSFRAYKVY